MHPVMILTIGVVGAAALVRWCVREVVRVNSDLDAVRAQASSVEPLDRRQLPTLKRDPRTGEYRPG
jgi:hypothetical protein